MFLRFYLLLIFFQENVYCTELSFIISGIETGQNVASTIGVVQPPIVLP